MIGILFMSCIGILILFIAVSNFVALLWYKGKDILKKFLLGLRLNIYTLSGVLVWIALLVCISSWKTIIRNPFEALKAGE